MLAGWVDAGQPAETFYDQTPRTHAAIMEGCIRREMRGIERDVALAWRVANFTGAGHKLKSLDRYLEQMRPVKVQTAEQVLAIFQGFAGRGLAKIRERKKVVDGK